MANNQVLKDEIIKFVRTRDYQLVRELGQGACGKTVLLHDDQIDEHFVCKKYVPYDESQRESLYLNFVREIKILHCVSHPNVIRIFNYYLYPDKHAGYILMEYVDGDHIEDYIDSAPEQVDELFIQAISGFSYLEQMGVLHRDIRPQNLMVTNTGQLKIIDLGFGKRVDTETDFEKSISLNLWCPPPTEFNEARYDFRTEVYFVGKLFEKLISEQEIANFKYPSILRSMCSPESQSRIESFVEIEKQLHANQFSEIGFERADIMRYREFAEALCEKISKIESSGGYTTDIAKIESSLADIRRKIMLEEFVPNASTVINCFISGTYYFKRAGLPTKTVIEFIDLMKKSSLEQKRIIIANLHTKFDAIQRYLTADISDDDIPF